MLRKVFYRFWRLYVFLRDPYILDVHVSEHCNLNCVGCNHYSPLAKPAFCDLSSLEQSLNILKTRKVLGMFKCIDLIGGEPLLNPNIVDVFKIARKAHPRIRIRLITNGLLLRKMPDSFWEACKHYEIIVAITHYPIPLDYESILSLCKENGVKYESFGDRTIHNAFSLYRLIPKPLEFDKQKCRENFFRCFMQCMQLVDNRIYGCPQCAYSKYLNESFDTDFKIQKGDYLEINSISKFKIIKFTLSVRPFCKYCKVPIASIDWKHSKCNAEEWIYTEQ